MADVLHTVAAEFETESGVRDTKAVAQALSDVLADTYRLMFKTHSYHWNVTGPLFYPIHKMTEEQYSNLFAASDEIAERIRALGHLAPQQLATLEKNSVVKDMDGTPSARAMVEDLAEDHQRVAHRLHALVELADEHGDPVTEDLATERSAFHEEAAWMLRATAAN